MSFHLSGTLGVLATLGVVALGCSSSDGSSASTPTTVAPDGGVPSTTAPVTSVPFETRLATAECAAYLRCDPVSFATYYKDQADCVARSAPTRAKGLHTTSVTVTDAQIDACAKAVSGRACNATASPAECTFKGSLANGAACTHGTQCQSGSCSGSVPPACGTCADAVPVTLGGEGATCGSGASCTGDLFCNFSTKKCERFAAAGADCSGPGVLCDLDLDCNYVTSKCEAPTYVALGQPCGADPDSGKTVGCLQSQCTGVDDDGAHGTCTAWGTEGAACDVTKSVLCDDSLFCEKGTCVNYRDERVCQ